MALQYDETINYISVQFWDGVYNSFSCAYSGRKEIYSFVQFWDGVYNSFSCAYSGRKEINSFAQFWGEVYNTGFSLASGSYNLSPEDHRVQQGEKVLNCGILLRRACYN